MTEALALEGGEKVLEIGTGSGYAAAVLAEIAGDVYTVERIGQLAEKAASTLADLGYDNVHVLHGDGTKGWPDHAPYDGIIVAAGGPKNPGLAERATQDRRPAGHSGGPRSQGARARPRHARFRKRIPARGPGRRPVRAAHRHEGWGGAEREPAPARPVPPFTDCHGALAQDGRGSPASRSKSIEAARIGSIARAHRRRKDRAARRGDATEHRNSTGCATGLRAN